MMMSSHGWNQPITALAELNEMKGNVCLGICPVCAVTFQSLDLEPSFFGMHLPFQCIRRVSRSSGQGQGHRSKECLCSVCMWSAFDRKSLLLLASVFYGRFLPPFNPRSMFHPCVRFWCMYSWVYLLNEVH